MKHTTPILSAVRATHEQDDGRDPYNTLARRTAPVAASRAAQLREAEQSLACYATELTLETES